MTVVTGKVGPAISDRELNLLDGVAKVLEKSSKMEALTILGNMLCFACLESGISRGNMLELISDTWVQVEKLMLAPPAGDA